MASSCFTRNSLTYYQGIKRGVQGAYFRVYLQYYYHALVFASQRQQVKRPLEDVSLSFLTCVAAFGYARGCNEFDVARKENNSGAINSVVIDRPSFLTFFWNNNVDSFSFIGCWRLIDRLWDIWDFINPVKIHGFVSAVLSCEMLNTRFGDNGTFAFRFSSQGGLAIDYVEHGKLSKAHWKFSSLNDSGAFLQKLYDQQRDGPFLKFLIDIADNFGPKIHAKELIFPRASAPGYNQAAYSAYARTDDDTMSTEIAANFVPNTTLGFRW